MKIAGVVNNFSEALEIEDIVKVFIIEKKILDIPSLNRTNKYKNVTNHHIRLFNENNGHYSMTSIKKNLHNKNNGYFRQVFNVRGLI
ncbi:MAG: hypothetical protein JSV67_06025 [Thermoplasmatales archaeon]|nr:MAG: hypothetical protein JSV67_06025 [Thermoplasmatales archaeon]